MNYIGLHIPLAPMQLNVPDSIAVANHEHPPCDDEPSAKRPRLNSPRLNSPDASPVLNASDLEKDANEALELYIASHDIVPASAPPAGANNRPIVPAPVPSQDDPTQDDDIICLGTTYNVPVDVPVQQLDDDVTILSGHIKTTYGPGVAAGDAAASPIRIE
jgi:hypothetical protein